MQQPFHETDHVRLNLLVPSLTLELSHPYRTSTARIQEVAFKYVRNVHGLRLAKHDPKALSYVLDSATIITHHIEEIVSVLAKAARPKRKSFQRHKCTGSANPNVSCGVFSKYGFSTKVNELAIYEGQPQTRNNESGKISFKVAQTPGPVSWPTRRYQKIDGDLASAWRSNSPPLSSLVALGVSVGRETSFTEPFAESPVPLVV